MVLLEQVIPVEFGEKGFKHCLSRVWVQDSIFSSLEQDCHSLHDVSTPYPNYLIIYLIFVYKHPLYILTVQIAHFLTKEIQCQTAAFC